MTPITFRLIDEVYRGIYPALEGSPQLLALVRLVAGGPRARAGDVLMGATFPTLTRYLARTSALSRAFGRLYAANTIGAIVGTLVAGLVLIELLGLSGALLVGAGCSLDRRARRAVARRAAAPATDGAAPTRSPAPAPPRADARDRPTPRAPRVRAGLDRDPASPSAIAFISA